MSGVQFTGVGGTFVGAVGVHEGQHNGLATKLCQ
jgi:hypothetical protein